VVCLCQGFIDRLIARGVPPEKLRLIPDWGDTEQIRPVESDGIFRRENGFLREQFLILHSGNMGKKQNLMNVVNAAERSQGDRNLAWLLVGQGEELPALRHAAEARAPNLRLLPLQPAVALPQMYAAADTLLLNQIAAMEDAVIPCKLLTYMAAGRPIVAAVNENCEAARIMRQARCGVIVPAENPEALTAVMVALRKDPELCRVLGANARAYAEQHFTKGSVLQTYDELFLNTLCTAALSPAREEIVEG